MDLYIDSHAHMNDAAFDADRAQVFEKIFASGVERCIEIGCAPDEWEPSLALARQYPGRVYAVLGVHPEYAPAFSADQLSTLQTLLADKNAVGMGEMGLDYTCLETADKNLQHDVFSQQLGLTKTVAKPLVLHVRRQAEDYAAYDDTFRLLKHEWTPARGLRHTGVLHCFCARYEEAKKALDMGLLLGINGCFTYKKNEYIREAVKKAGADKIILETDCPYLSPQGKRGQRNDPSNIPLIGQFAADYLNIPAEELARLSTRNAKELYALV